MIIIRNKKELEEMKQMVDELLDVKNPTEQDRNLFEIYAKSIKYYDDKIKLNGNDRESNTRRTEDPS